MRVRLKLIFPLLLIVALLSGCGIESVPMPSLPRLNMGTSTLEGTVEYVNGRTCQIRVTVGDSHFDAESEDEEADLIYLTFTNLEGKKSILPGNTVRFDYDYSTQVSEYESLPHITVNLAYVS